MRLAYPAAIILLVLGGCRSGKDQSGARRSVVGPAVLRDVARLTGTVTPSDTIQIKSQITQQITKIHVKEGQFVKKGQLLFDLDREQLQLRHEQLLIAVSTAKLGLQAAERDLERAQSQLRNGSVSSDHVQDLQFARDKSRLAFQNAQLDLKSNERDLYYTRIVAPRDGQLIHLNVSEGEMAVAANSISGGVLGVIADPSRLKVVVEVSELDYPRLHLGQDVEISTEARPDRLLKGKVTYIPPAAQSSSSNSSVMVFKVEVTIDPAAQPTRLSDVAGGSRHAWGDGSPSTSRHGRPDSAAFRHHRSGSDSSGFHARKKASLADSGNGSLAPGMTVNVDFVFLERKVDLSVPYDMVSSSPDGNAKIVWVKSNPKDAPEGVESAKQHRNKRFQGNTRPHRVQVGATDFKNYEILGGLSAGDTIFAAPDTSKMSGRKGGPGGPP